VRIPQEPHVDNSWEVLEKAISGAEVLPTDAWSLGCRISGTLVIAKRKRIHAGAIILKNAASVKL
jgi:hypothetical protein